MVATLKTTIIQEPSSATANMTLDTAGNVTGGANLVATGMPYGSSSFLRNRIINGNMVIDQRNAGAQITAANLTTGAYMVDRWVYISSQAAKFTAQQNAGAVTSAVGFPNYLGMTVASAVTVGASDYFAIAQSIEGFNFADLTWGTANAKTITLSFQVYSSLTGTFGGSLTNSATNRSYPFSYTVSSANTWTSISVTIAGDTSGTWIGSTNGVGVYLRFGLGAGSTYSATAGAWASGNYVSPTGATSVVGTSGATFYVTGVQLEQGNVATPFERPLYSKQLADCQRYYQQYNSAPMVSGNTTAGGTIYQDFIFSVIMRSSPTGALSGTFTYSNASAYTFNAAYVDHMRISLNITAAGYGFGYSGVITLSAEL